MSGAWDQAHSRSLDKVSVGRGGRSRTSSTTSVCGRRQPAQLPGQQLAHQRRLGRLDGRRLQQGRERRPRPGERQPAGHARRRIHIPGRRGGQGHQVRLLGQHLRQLRAPGVERPADRPRALRPQPQHRPVLARPVAAAGGQGPLEQQIDGVRRLGQRAGIGPVLGRGQQPADQRVLRPHEFGRGRRQIAGRVVPVGTPAAGLEPARRPRQQRHRRPLAHGPGLQQVEHLLRRRPRCRRTLADGLRQPGQPGAHRACQRVGRCRRRARCRRLGRRHAGSGPVGAQGRQHHRHAVLALRAHRAGAVAHDPATAARRTP